MSMDSRTRDFLLFVLNQNFEIEKKMGRLDNGETLRRNVDRIYNRFEDDFGLRVEDVSGQPYNETRIDCEATVTGDATEGLVITEVIKPLIRQNIEGVSTIVQKAVVLVEG